MSPRLFLRVAGTEARTRLAYRADFWVSAVLVFAGQLAVAYFVWQAMFRESGAATIGGYDPSGMLLYYVAVLLLAKIVRGPQFEQAVSQDIYEGSLNRYLVFPVPYLPFKYAQQLGTLAPVALQVLLFGGLLVVLVPGSAGAQVTPGSVLMAAGATLIANLLYFLIGWPIQAVAFWADNVWSLSVAQRLVTALLGGALVPLTLLPEAAQGALRWLPFRFLFAWPAESLLGHVTPGAWLADAALALAWCAVISLVGRAVWRRGDLQYSGIGI